VIAVGLIVFVVIGTLGPGIPLGIYFTMGEKCTTILASL
jgi:hypothetical protein